MFRKLIALGALCVLTACGDPLGELDRLSDVDLAENDPAASALPSADEIARDGFFGTDAASGETVAVTLPTPQEDTTEPVKPVRRGGLLGILGRVLPDAAPEAPVAALNVPAEAAEPQTQEEIAEDAPVLVASLSTEEVAPRRRGLFGLGAAPSAAKDAPRDGPDRMEVSYGTVLPYGVIARVCNARLKPLGRKVDSSSSGHKLYDSDPDSASPRTYYITGFRDDCPRQLTAANVLLGEPSFYEQLHYGPGGQHLATAATDRAYEKVKSKVCGVRKGKPCGAKLKKLERSTIFVNAYQRFGDNANWSELLIHDGQVVAEAMKTSG